MNTIVKMVFKCASRMTSKTVDGVTTTYTYDANGQLLSESRSGYSASYTYDANGNRASRTVNGVTETYTVDSGDKLTQVSVSGVATKTFGYDGAGRTTSIQTSAGTTSFSYDFESRVTGITYPNSSTNSFAYNGLDTRVGKTDSAGTSTFRRMGAGVTAPVLGDGSASFTPGISERRGSTSSFYGADYLGTNSALYSSGETVSATRQYDAFGNLTSSSGSSANPFGFAGNWGYQNDSDSGLMLLGHRYYDASTGWFLTRDPIKDGRNWYAYCESSPVWKVDPLGLLSWESGLGLVFFAGAALMLAPAALTGVTAVFVGTIFIGGYTAVRMAIGAHLDGNDPADVPYGIAFMQVPLAALMKLSFPFTVGLDLTDTFHHDLFGASPIKAHDRDEQQLDLSFGSPTSAEWEATRKRMFPLMQ